MTDAERLAAEYERKAREFRAEDWEAFLEDADQDPAGIGYEMADTAQEMGLDIDIDAAFDVAYMWLRELGISV